MSAASQFFGGGSGGFYQQLLFTVSDTFTCPVAGKYLVSLIGGGGGGSNYGGGAGGFAQSLMTFSAGTVITYTIGAGSGRDTAGNGSSATATGMSLTANGGGRGNVVSAAGGTASGGNLMNVTGGTGGPSTAYCGGGAVGVYGKVCNAPTATYHGAGTSGVEHFSLINDSVSIRSYSASFGPIQHLGFINGRFLAPCGEFNDYVAGSNSYTSGPGAGGLGQSSGSGVNGNSGGIFAGGGGGGNSSSYGGNGGIGGGGGGSYSGAVFGGFGGRGAIVIEYFIS